MKWVLSMMMMIGGTAGALKWNGTWGYVPVGTKNVSGELFYWYFPARNGDPKAPTLLWLQGGPGASSIEDGLLRLHGPYKVENGSLVARDLSWNNEFNMLYVDQPVGTGFSVSYGGYASSQSQVTDMLMQFLRNFNVTHICGESYGGHYIPPLAVAYHPEGVSIGDGFTDPATQVLTKPSQAYHFGLIDEKTLAAANVEALKASAAALGGDFVRAKRHRDAMEDIVEKASDVNPYDVRKFGNYNDTDVVAFLLDPSTMEILRVKKTFGTDDGVKEALEGDVMRSYKQDVKKLVDRGIPVLLYQGQFDWKDGATSNEAWIRDILLQGDTSYLRAPRRILGKSKRPYGWIKNISSFADVVISSAGHLAPMDQPLALLDLITRFVRGEL